MNTRYIVTGLGVVLILIISSLMLLDKKSSLAKNSVIPAPDAEALKAEGIQNLTDNKAESTTGQFNGFQLRADASDRLHVVFRDNRDNPNIEEIYYKRFNGTAWEQEQKLSDIAGMIPLKFMQKLHVAGPALAASAQGDVHLVWNVAIVSRFNRNKIVVPRKFYYQRSLDGGTTFSKPLLLGEGGDQWGGATICYGEKGAQKIVNVISTDTKQGLYAYYSTDNGANFKKSPIATYASAKEAPVCAIDTDGSVYVVWQDDRDGVVVNGLKRRDIHFARSRNAGETWEAMKNLTNTPRAGSSDASLALDASGNIHVAYHDDSNDGNNSWEIYYTSSSDKGNTWTTPQKLTKTNPASTGINIDLPSIAVTRDGIVHIAWEDQRDGYFRIYYTNNRNGIWQPEMPISSTIRGSVDPSIAPSYTDNSLHVVWSGINVIKTQKGWSGNRDIFYKHILPPNNSN